jgi:hypothetical protein
VEDLLWDIEGYPKLWPKLTDVNVLEKDDRHVKFEFRIDLTFSPVIKGQVERPAKGVIVFHDTRTGGKGWYQLRNAPGGCQILYHLSQPEGRYSEFVELAMKVERNLTDAGEIGGVLASLRGLSRPERDIAKATENTPAARQAWDELASRGTAVRTLHRKGRPAAVVTKRRIQRSPTSVLFSIRNRAEYARSLDVVKSVKERGRKVNWSIGYFGGRVRFTTDVTERGDVNAPGGLVITERVSGGDIDDGFWQWTVRAVDGGTEVELYVDANFPEGSMIMSRLAKGDELLAMSLQLQFGLALTGGVVGGSPLPLAQSVASAPH